MRRREFLAAGICGVSAIVARPLIALPTHSNRGAIVIGVGNVDGLPRLKGAASGAQKMATWLAGEHFDVKLFTDTAGPVKANDLFAEVKRFINRGTLDQLVIYFAGHGFISGTISEFWLLSDALQDPNEAVVLTECCLLAEQSGIPNVVFISDACRSLAGTLNVERVRGSLIFPNAPAARGPESVVDQFLATRVGAAAYEYPVDKTAPAYQAVYTTCFLEAFQHPYADMVQDLRGEKVIPNRRLKPYLAQEVPKRAQSLGITLDQRPDSKVYSDEPVFIGHAVGQPRQAGQAAPTVADVARLNLTEIGIHNFEFNAEPLYPTNLLTEVAVKCGFQRTHSTVQRAFVLPQQFGGRAGFRIFGQHILSVAAHRTAATFNNDTAGATVRIDEVPGGAASVALRFADGSGTILAALDRFIGNVAVENGKVINVSYVPSFENPNRQLYENQASQVAQLHAVAAAAAHFGLFRVDGPEITRRRSAAELAGRIRELKGLDPTLGIYAAYAYADAQLLEDVRSVRQNLLADLGSDLFDVAMLAGTLSERPSDARVPFCPMLSQGWGLLRVKQVRLNEGISRLREHLQVSLWMTLDKEGANIAEEIIGSGTVR